MKITILTQYFPPEVGAPQNRLFELAVRLKKKGADITIVTAMPNYPQMEIHEGFKRKFYSFENIEGLKTHRCWIFVCKNKNIILRLLNYFSFVISSIIIGLLKLKKQDVLIVESPPLFLGISGLLLAKAKKAKFVFNVSDLWPESAEKLEIISNKFILHQTTKLEEFFYKKADLITGQTQGICKNISQRFPRKNVYWLKNGVDTNFYNLEKPINLSWRKENGFNENDIIFIYAGIIGYAQGLDIILNVSKEFIEKSEIKFVFLGNGPEKDRLVKLKNKLNLTNVYFFDSEPKCKMQEILLSTNASIIPLKKIDLFKGAIPSKIFENLALKKPIILGVDGEARKLFIDNGKCGLYFEPENEKELCERIEFFINNPQLMLEMGENGYNYVKKEFNRETISNNLWEKLIELKL